VSGHSGGLAVESLGILHVLAYALLIGRADSMQHHFFLRINLRLSFFVELHRPKVASRLLGIAISELVMQTTTAPSPKTWEGTSAHHDLRRCSCLTRSHDKDAIAVARRA
jgi:hypothetical protein